MKREMAVSEALLRGIAIPAHPLALTLAGKLDERRQRALSRYYLAAGAGGLAVGVHTTQFAIRNVGLYEPVLTLAKEERDRAGKSEVLLIGGICGPTTQALREAATLNRLGYNAGLLSLATLGDASDEALLTHCCAVAEVIPLFGFYLQRAVGGRVLSETFWRGFFAIENVVAVKVAPFDRYATLTVARALADSGRTDVALYTGNDDTIVHDLITPQAGQRFVGGLLGHWAVDTQQAAQLLAECQQGPMPALLERAGQETERNAAFFDATNGFAGCIAGLHYVLQKQGLLDNLRLLDEHEALSPGQAETIDRVRSLWPHLTDDAFITAHREEWLNG
ncbi:MAG: hypothetical protein QM758_21410 [Armatimonas sp.]